MWESRSESGTCRHRHENGRNPPFRRYELVTWIWKLGSDVSIFGLAKTIDATCYLLGSASSRWTLQKEVGKGISKKRCPMVGLLCSSGMKSLMLPAWIDGCCWCCWKSTESLTRAPDRNGRLVSKEDDQTRSVTVNGF